MKSHEGTMTVRRRRALWGPIVLTVALLVAARTGAVIGLPDAEAPTQLIERICTPSGVVDHDPRAARCLGRDYL